MIRTRFIDKGLASSCAAASFKGHGANKEMIDEADEASLLEHLPALHYKEVM